MVPDGPFAHDEQLGDVHLYERLTHQVGERRYNPTGTTWVWAFRGVWNGRQVMVFRPGEWLWDASRDGPRLDRAIEKDLGGLIVVSAQLPSYSWAAIDALPGVRLRTLVAAAHAYGITLPVELVLDIAVRTAELALGGDTFVGWDGELWLCPRFQACWDSEMPSTTGFEVFDTLTVTDSVALYEMLGGPVERLFVPKMPRSTSLPGPIDDDVARIIDGGTMTRDQPFVEECRAASSVRRPVDPEELGLLARELLADSHERQQRSAS